MTIPLKERCIAALQARSEWLILAGLVLLIATLSLAPVLRLAMTALTSNGVFDFERIATLLSHKQTITATINTLYIAFASTILALIIGSAAGIMTVFTPLRFDDPSPSDCACLGTSIVTKQSDPQFS